MNKGLIINEALMEGAKELEPNDFKEFLTKLFNYSVYGECVEFENQYSKILFTFAKPFIDYNNEKYQEKVNNSKTAEEWV